MFLGLELVSMHAAIISVSHTIDFVCDHCGTVVVILMPALVLTTPIIISRCKLFS